MQADRERIRETLSTKIGKEAEMKGTRDGELSREVTSRKVSSPTCFSVELGSEGWEGTGDEGPESGVQDCHPPSIENRPPCGASVFIPASEAPKKAQSLPGAPDWMRDSTAPFFIVTSPYTVCPRVSPAWELLRGRENVGTELALGMFP